MSRRTDVRPAGPDHQVITVKDRSNIYRREPCGGCPWRIDQTGQFPAEAFRHSASTAYDCATHLFACHESGAEKSATCAGFLLRNATHNLAVRLKLRRNAIDMGRVHDGGHALHSDYRAMAVANGVPEDDPALSRCRGDMDFQPGIRARAGTSEDMPS